MHIATITAPLVDTSSTAAGSKTMPVTVAVPIGTMCVLAVATNALSAQDGSFVVTDSKGNTWTERADAGTGAAHQFKSGTIQLSVLYSKLTAALTTADTITVSHPAANVILWTGLVEAFDDLTAFDVVASANGASAAPASGPSAAAVQSNELLFTATAWGATPTPTVPGGYSSSPEVSAAGSSTKNLQNQWKYVTTGGTRSGSLPLSGSSSWCQVTVAFTSAAPPQILVPISDITTTGWTQTGGTSGSDWTSIDEGSVPDTTDYLTSGVNPVAQVLEGALSVGSTPSDLTGHKIAAYLRLNGAAGTALLRVKQGSTIIATSSAITLTPGVWAWYTFTLTSTQAGNITDYTTLRYHLEVTAT